MAKLCFSCVGNELHITIPVACHWMRAATSLSVSIPHDVTDRMYLGTAVANCYLYSRLIWACRGPYTV